MAFVFKMPTLLNNIPLVIATNGVKIYLTYTNAAL
jgi:hypothetical protein